ncbi:MAG: GNAT family N-acetyltransferase [Anaerolineae bacterium]
MDDLPGYDIRYTIMGDEPYLRSWLLSEGMLHWFPMSTEKEVDDAVQCWIGFCRYSASLTAIIDGAPCGIGTLFLMPYRKVAHHCLFKVIVDPHYQHRGIGSSLIKNLKHLAKSYFRLELMHIEVFEGNPILKLLQNADFKEFARQERYVKEAGRYFTRILLECELK